MMAKEKQATEAEIYRERLKELDKVLRYIRDPWIRRNLARERSSLRESVSWYEQEEPCSGSGYAHAPHGACPGYSKDRT